jgi:putative ABC transport system substrate-binding protein
MPITGLPGRRERRAFLAIVPGVLLVAPLVAQGQPGSAFHAKKVTSTVPIVCIGEPDPIGTELVTSLARPGANVTGLADAHTDLVPKRLELLKQLAPSTSRVALLRNPANPSTAPQLRIAEAAAPALGLTVFPVGVKIPRSLLSQADQVIE